MKLLIWEYRDKSGVSLRELAKKTGISKTALNNIENKVKSPTLLQLEQISKALEVPMKVLFVEDWEM